MRKTGWVAMPGLLGLAAFVGVVGCRGSANEVAASPADLESMCQAMCDHATRCRGGAATDCFPSCETRLGDATGLSRDALAILASCYRDPACLDDDLCEERALTRDPGVRAMVEQCIAFARTCPYELDLSLCLRAGLMLAETRDQVERCTAGQCTTEQAAACFAF